MGDFGCGDAKIYKECPNQNVHSFDLVSEQPYITACDIAHVPLADASLDIAIFCLALMGHELERVRCGEQPLPEAERSAVDCGGAQPV